MARPGLRNCDDSYEARRGKIRRTKLSDYASLIQKVSSSENIDEDYVAFLKLSYNYDKSSDSYTNEHGNGGSYDEVEDEDEADPQYKMFLANAKLDGTSYVLNVDTKVEFPLFLKYEKECECNYACECLCWLKQKDVEMQEDAVDEERLPNTCSKDELKNRRFPRTDLGDDINRPIGGTVVVCEPSDPTSGRNNRITRRKLSPEKHGASKRQDKREAKIKSREEKTDLGDDINRSIGGIFEPSDRTPHRNNRITSRKLSPEKHGASKRQDKRVAKIKSREEKMMGKRSKTVHVRGKEKTSDVDEDYMCILKNLQCENLGMKASLRSDCNIECEATEDDLEILYDTTDMLKKSQFRRKVMALLSKPHNHKEYKELWTIVNEQKLVVRNMESRRGGVNSYKTNKLGKSYLDHYKDLEEKLKEVDNNERKKLKILRGFSFWLQNLTNKGAFRPWNDTEFLARVAESR